MQALAVVSPAGYDGRGGGGRSLAHPLGSMALWPLSRRGTLLPPPCPWHLAQPHGESRVRGQSDAPMALQAPRCCSLCREMGSFLVLPSGCSSPSMHKCRRTFRTSTTCTSRPQRQSQSPSCIASPLRRRLPALTPVALSTPRLVCQRAPTVGVDTLCGSSYDVVLTLPAFGRVLQKCTADCS